MCVADELCDELFRWINQLKKCARYLMDLATELENTREAVTRGQLVGNTVTVLGSAALVGTGIATLLTGGAAAPLLAFTAGVTAGAGTATSLALSLVEKWKSSDTMKKAKKKFDKIEQIQDNIQRLQKKLQEECEWQGFEASSFVDPSCEAPSFIKASAKFLKALAKRKGRDLSHRQLWHFLESYGMDICDRDSEFNPHTEFLLLPVVLGFSTILMNKVVKKLPKYSILPSMKATEGMLKTAKGSTTAVKGSMKIMAKGTVQTAGGIFGLILTVPDLVDNCEELIENKHETEASTSLKTKAKEIREAVTKLEKQMKELQEMLEEIPEMECHIDLYQEMSGSQIYTRGTVCIEYKQTRKQERKTLKFILLSTKHTEVTEHTFARKQKNTSGDNKNKRQKKAASSTEHRSLYQQKKHAKEKSSNESKTKVRKLCLSTILLSNVRSLPNKIEELKEMTIDVKNVDMDLICLTETWLNDNSPSTSLDGYESYRVDRVKEFTKKGRGGGLMMQVNEAWATDVEVENIMITPDYELMVASIIPHDHPEDAPPLTFILVYIPPGDNMTQAANEIADFYFRAQEKYPGGPVFLLGDFNQCDFSHLNLEQYVTCPTRSDNILDMCYGNVQRAYRSECRPPLGRSDHKVILLFPKHPNDPFKNKKCKHDHS